GCLWEPRATGPMSSSLLYGEGTGELTERFLMFFVGDLTKVACHFETHPLAFAGGRAVLRVEPLEEIIDRHAQTASQFEQAPGRDAIDVALVFVLLLILHANGVGQLALGEAKHHAPLADAC